MHWPRVPIGAQGRPLQLLRRWANRASALYRPRSLACALRSYMRCAVSILYAMAGIAMATSADAASIVYKGNFEGLNAIAITGTIEEGDSDRFDIVAASLGRPTVVILDSNGGQVGNGL